MNDRVRLTLDLSNRLNVELERLSELRQESKADTLRFGIELLIAADRAKNDGMTVGAWSADGNKTREFIGA